MNGDRLISGRVRRRPVSKGSPTSKENLQVSQVVIERQPKNVGLLRGTTVDLVVLVEVN